LKWDFVIMWHIWLHIWYGCLPGEGHVWLQIWQQHTQP
jgi:hypothetical protein